MSPLGRPRKWIDKKDVDYGRAVLKCKLVDRIHKDGVIGRKVLRKSAVSLSDAFWICDNLTPQEAGKALRAESHDIAQLLLENDIRRRRRTGSRLRDFYYTWYRPGNAVLRTVGRRVDVLRSNGLTLDQAIATVSRDGLHPRRKTKKEFLPPNVVRSFYYRCKRKGLY